MICEVWKSAHEYKEITANTIVSKKAALHPQVPGQSLVNSATTNGPQIPAIAPIVLPRVFKEEEKLGATSV